MIDALQTDDNTTSVQVGTTFVTSDVSNTPKGSPFTLTGGIDVFTVPPSCYEFIVNPVANDLLISEMSNLSTHDTVAKTTKEAIGCARMTRIYVQGTMGDTLNFRFTSLS